MGICRCHRLSTTNHFCYEHRMNVCQYCVLESHQNAPIIPPSNAESPIADELNSILPNIGWYQNLIDSGFKPSVYSPTRKTPKSNETFSSVNQTLDSSCIIN
ncbi:hypothetical protein HZS_7198 [Henneguya salminicola]|nr:hypothetical protein HZS_7198 [Henneguya salminicola]